MAGQQQQSPQGDDSFAILWIIVILFVVFGCVWYMARAEIVSFIFKLRLLEINLISLFSSGLAETKALIENTPPSIYKQISLNTLGDISVTVGSYLSYPIAVILGSLGVIIYFNHATLQYRKTYSMQNLVMDEVKDWPQIAPVSKLDLTSQHIEKGAWSMGLTPMQFAKKYRLLIEERAVGSTNAAIFDVSTKITVTVSRGEAYQMFALQLGPYWRGADKIPIYAQALFSVFAARCAGDRAGATKLLEQIAISTASGKLDFSGVKELYTKHKDNKLVLKATSRHAFMLTAMATMLVLARQDGVLPSADFLWLKPVDRRMWFMLNSVGRKTPFAEVGGPFAHWIVENQYGSPIKVPMIEEAINALESAIKDIVYISDEKEG